MKKLSFLAVLMFLSFSLSSQTPNTWSESVACIIYSHCTSCHNPNGAAPFSLVDYLDAKSFAPAIKASVVNQTMPPWPPDENYQKLAHERVLDTDEIQKISDWVDGGALEGNPNLAPVPPVYNSAHEITNPDLTVRIPDYTVPTLTEDLYRCFVVPTNQTIDNFITAMEVIPGNMNIVHHVLVFQDTSSAIAALDSADPGPGWTSFGGTGSNSSKLIAGWVPGSKAEFMPNGLGVVLPKGAQLILQIHYPVYSSWQMDSTRINLKLTNQLLRPIIIEPPLNHYNLSNGPLFVPKNTVKTFHSQYTVPSQYDLSLISIAPHAHLICEALWAYAVLPNNDTLPLIDIPEWDFHWQGTYQFQKFLHLPPGTVLHGYGRYNNTTSNPAQPSNPPQDVWVGDATTDEMLVFYMSVTPYYVGDEDIVIDTSSHPSHYDNCDPFLVEVEDEIQAEMVSVYPNPAQDRLHVQLPKGQKGSLSLVSLTGQKVAQFELAQSGTTLNVGDLPRGLFFSVLRDQNGGFLRTEKLILY